jgi:hypothetical protein
MSETPWSLLVLSERLVRGGGEIRHANLPSLRSQPSLVSLQEQRSLQLQQQLQPLHQ